jgi:hypothetical protein
MNLTEFESEQKAVIDHCARNVDYMNDGQLPALPIRSALKLELRQRSETEFHGTPVDIASNYPSRKCFFAAARGLG